MWPPEEGARTRSPDGFGRKTLAQIHTTLKPGPLRQRLTCQIYEVYCPAQMISFVICSLST